MAIIFGALTGFLDVRYGSRDGSACAEFSWQGNDGPAVADGRSSEPPVVSSATSTSTTPMNQASSPHTSDFFNSLLGRFPESGSYAEGGSINYQ